MQRQLPRSSIQRLRGNLRYLVKGSGISQFFQARGSLKERVANHKAWSARKVKETPQENRVRSIRAA